MFMRFSFLIILLLTCFVSRTFAEPLSNTSGSLPAWLQTRILQPQEASPSASGRSVYRTEFEGKTVYYVSPTCCDIPSELYDEAGHLLCRPDGGFAGGDGKCPRFIPNPASLSLVWPTLKERSTPAQKLSPSSP